MDTIFTPPKRRGLAFHLSVLSLLFIGSIFTILRANRAEVGAAFSLWLLSFFILALPIPILVYRAYALQRATYQISPEGLRINWGLRAEEIPMSKILWLSPETHLERPLPLPWLHWPGGVLGVRKIGAGAVEYMASRPRDLLIIATPGKMYAISPENPEKFIRTFQRQAEIGTLAPIVARSVYPTFLLGSVWANLPARVMILGGLLMIITLLLWTTLASSSFTAPLPLSSPQLFLLPIVNALFFLVNLLLGLFFFRSPQSQPLAYLLWGASLFTSLLFFVVFYNFLT